MFPKAKFYFSLAVISTLFLSQFIPTSAFSPKKPQNTDPGLTRVDQSNWMAESTVISSSLQPKNIADMDGTSSSIVINEVMFYPANGEPEWVELKNVGTLPVDVSGYAITDEDDNWYYFPDALPEVPVGAFVVVIFDGAGAGADDVDFSDNLSTFHSGTGVINIFDDAGDQVALYAKGNKVFLPIITRYTTTMTNNPLPKEDHHTALSIPLPVGEITSFVAWGNEPGDDALKVTAEGLWDLTWFVDLSNGTGLIEEHSTIDQSIGLTPGSISSFMDDWAVYQPNETTQGDENSTPTISWFYPADGALIDGSTFAISWNSVNGATKYQFQLDETTEFLTPLVDLELTDPSYVSDNLVLDGFYYWRVKVFFPGQESAWSTVKSVQTLDLSAITVKSPNQEANDTYVSKTLPITWQLQHKDTNMMCLDGDAENGAMSWDTPHAERGDHGNMYCARASLSMMASYYGSNLSQDRISYEIFKDGPPEGDLGHNIGVSLEEIDQSINWALGTTITREDRKPSFQEIKTWIDNNQPVYSTIPGHARLVVGYAEFTLGLIRFQFIRILDPWNRSKMVSYADDMINHIWVGPSGPTGAPNIRMEEDQDNDGIRDTLDDSDNDGIVDFDESNRFTTNPTNPDSDQDGVPDQLDIREYIFNNNGSYNHRRADFDFDGLRKELDSDNDRPDWVAWTSDGCEDTNHNGFFEPALGETSNFNRLSEKACPPSADMVLVPAGEFQMGCDPDHNGGWSCNSNELPLHTVYLDAYQIDKTEVTNAAYAQCVSAGICTPPYSNSSNTRPSYYDNPIYADYPVIYVNWNQATAYCTWAGKRLPSEAEWEKAARGTNVQAYPWGNAAPTCALANFWGFQPCVGDTSAVGSYPAGASPYGALNMTGNVYEWVNDWYDSIYYGNSPYSNPPGPATGEYRVLRGGTWYYFTNTLRVAYRTYQDLDPTVGSVNIGFRCARSDDSSTPPGAFNKVLPADGAADQPVSVTLDWSDSVGAASYAYCYDTTNDNACTDWVNTGATSQAQVSGLSNSTTYYWQVKAINTAGETYANGSTAAYWSFTTGGSLPPGDMVLVPAGEFQMGCDPDHNGGYSCGSDELPLHTVYLDAYLIDKTEVTNAQYAQCVTSGGCTAPSYFGSNTRPSYYDNPTYASYPVIYVDWYQATAYCAWAGKRLPTEAEWEKAARGTTPRTYPWGDNAPTCALVNGYVNDNYCVGDTSAAGSYPAGASPYGALDMAGNVWEWVNDWYNGSYYSNSPYSNPPGPTTSYQRVLRSGSWYYLAENLRTAQRGSYYPANGYSHLGFRCARQP